VFDLCEEPVHCLQLLHDVTVEGREPTQLLHLLNYVVLEYTSMSYSVCVFVFYLTLFSTSFGHMMAAGYSQFSWVAQQT